MNKTVFLTLGLFVATVGFAQTQDFAARFNSLFLEGNRVYTQTGNKARLLPVIDSLQALIDQGRNDRPLTSEERLMYYLE